MKGWLVVALLLGTLTYALAEELTLTTYYPSPRGVYDELRTKGDVGIGKLDPPGARLEIVGGGATSATSALRIRNVDSTPLLEVQNGGNVGIGTTSPSAKLEVAGQLKITGGAPGPNKALTSDVTGLGTWKTLAEMGALTGSGTTNTVAKWTGGTSLGDSTLFDNGNVGIGTASPTQQLDINGQVRIRGGNPAAGRVLRSSDNSGTATWAVSSETEVVGGSGGIGGPLILSCPAGKTAVAGMCTCAHFDGEIGYTFNCGWTGGEQPDAAGWFVPPVGSTSINCGRNDNGGSNGAVFCK